MLLYSLLHLFGYGLTIEDLQQFRQLDSKTPGHPEYGHTRGVETTTGPLGQGIANGVGFALAESYLAAKFNKPGYPVVDHRTYALRRRLPDGGHPGEALSLLAGTWALDKLTVIYDSNDISIEGSTNIAFREDVAARYAYGWQVLRVEDGTDVDAIAAALEQAKAETNKPTMIIVRTQIGYGCPAKQGKSSAHGEPPGGRQPGRGQGVPGLAGRARLLRAPGGVRVHRPGGPARREGPGRVGEHVRRLREGLPRAGRGLAGLAGQAPARSAGGRKLLAL